MGRQPFVFEVACPLNSARAFYPNPPRLGAGPSIPIRRFDLLAGDGIAIEFRPFDFVQ